MTNTANPSIQDFLELSHALESAVKGGSSSKSSTSSSRVTLSRRVIDQGLVILSREDSKDTELLQAVCGTISMAFTTVYSARSKAYEREKLHLSFISKLCTLHMNTMALDELWRLFCRLQKSRAKPDWGRILSIPCDSEDPHPMKVSIVVSMHILLLKVYSESSKVSYDHIMTAYSHSDLALGWLSCLDYSEFSHRSTLVAKLFFSLSLKAKSPLMRLQLRLRGLELTAEPLEVQYKLLLSSFNESQHDPDLLQSICSRVMGLVEKITFPDYARQFTAFCAQHMQESLESGTNTPLFQLNDEVEELLKSIQNSSELSVLHTAFSRAPAGVWKEHRILTKLAQLSARFINDKDFDRFAVFVVDNSCLFAGTLPYERILRAMVEHKDRLALAATAEPLTNLCGLLADIFLAATDLKSAMQISDLLLYCGYSASSEKQAIRLRSDLLLAMAVDIETRLLDAAAGRDLFHLTSKALRLAVTLMRDHRDEEAFDCCLACLEKVCARLQSVQPFLFARDRELQAIMDIVTRLSLDHAGLLADRLVTTNCLVWEVVLSELSKSLRSVRVDTAKVLMGQIWKTLSPYEHPVRVSIAVVNYFIATGTLYPKWLIDHLAKIEDLGNDQDLADYSHAVLGLALGCLAMTKRDDAKTMFRDMTKALIVLQDTAWPSHNVVDSLWPAIVYLCDFLAFQFLHESQIKLCLSILAAVSVDMEKSTVLRLMVSQALIELGYSDSALINIAQVLDTLPGHIPERDLAIALNVEAELETGQLRAATEKLQALLSGERTGQWISPGRNSGEPFASYERRLVASSRVIRVAAKVLAVRGATETAVFHTHKLAKFLQSYVKRVGEAGVSLAVLSALLDQLMLTSQLYERLGLIPEYNSTVKEIRRLAAEHSCPLRMTAVLSFDGEVRVRMNQLETAKTGLKESETLLEAINLRDLNFLRLVHAFTQYLQRSGLFTEEALYYDISKQTYEELQRYKADLVEQEKTDLVENMANLELIDKTVLTSALVSAQVSGILSQVYSLGLQDKVEQASELIAKYTSAASDHWKQEEALSFEYLRARNNYLKARDLLQSDPVYAVVHDSALALPSITHRDTPARSGRVSKTYAVSMSALALLKEAQTSLQSRAHEYFQSCSSIDVGNVAALIQDIAVLASGIGGAAFAKGLRHHFTLLECARAFTFANDKTLNSGQEKHVQRLLEPSSDLKYNSQALAVLDTIPSDWLVLTIDHSATSGNLIVSRYEARQWPPMTVSLPLNRHNSRDADEKAFTLEEGLEQLRDIIRASNATASAARANTITTKEDRKAWWKERYALEDRLKALLSDAQYCWLGGFQSLFSARSANAEVLEDFRIAFDKLLARHLPSRARAKRSRQPLLSQISIYPAVFGFFLELETINDESPALIDDLLYFVLDILQFHGEQNAYDELDVDHILVDLEDLVMQFKARSMTSSRQFAHTVLILDNECVQFPWESLPVLRGRSVSRVPSLTVMAHLLDKVNHDISVPVHNLKYMLNPAGDLTRTQEMFEPRFAEIGSWQGIVAAEPSESEFATMLTTGDVFVYMGHGGGHQYIRPSKLKALDQCCPALLLGCSSGALENGGLYASWGTPLGYLTAGSTMVLANMWDVTDRDIDKFSLAVLERWGVLAEENRGKTTIAEAVATSRAECKLEYLNGSAPVIYGLPLIIRSN